MPSLPCSHRIVLRNQAKENAMDHNRLDLLTQSVAASSRRGVVHALARGGLAAIIGWPLRVSVDAKTNHHKKHKKKSQNKNLQRQPLPPPALNAFGCVDIGQACRGDSTLCCSGVCQGGPPQAGQPDTSFCIGHNAGICGPDSDACLAEVSCNPSNPSCRCALTTGSAGFCADLTPFFL